MYVLYYIRTSYVEQVVVAFQHVADLGKALATEMFFLQAILLDHRSHAAVKHKYSVFDSLFQIHLFLLEGSLKTTILPLKRSLLLYKYRLFIGNHILIYAADFL